ncbi:hypothetical protein AnigIFM63604_003097 [Aspergillus niger]|uniref:Uncharacterized protein n=1 Tax=Aspergillus niger TaxID=5061 RepID=A0A9W6AD27_ASPNG|nr:hypothetical protein AnigIFM63326_003946 [Aspergillus niger]GLA41333.1 hypothetical protein AnigIFM63309_009421 [Aspergillus niger]GLA55878.1 hypothetical protein AnigIFM63604_003097 [Aspergillus niger]
MRGTNPLSPNRNDMPISGRVSGLGPSVEDALWRGSATVPPVLNVNLSRINLNLRESQSIGPWDGEKWSIRDQIRDPSGDQPNDGDRSNNRVGQRHGEKSRRFRQSNIVHPVQ